MENPTATLKFKAEIERVQQNTNPIVRAKIAAVVEEATKEWNSERRMVSVHSHVYQKLMAAGLIGHTA